MNRARAVLLGGLVVGVLDIGDAIVITWARGGSPVRMLQGIAGGLLGRETARAGGAGTALLGLALHFCIATTVVLVYHYAAARMAALHRRPYTMGALYGIAVWQVMTGIVVPLSAIGTWPPRFTTTNVANGLFAHIFLVGIPAALFARRAFGRPAAPVDQNARPSTDSSWSL